MVFMASMTILLIVTVMVVILTMMTVVMRTMGRLLVCCGGGHGVKVMFILQFLRIGLCLSIFKGLYTIICHMSIPLSIIFAFFERNG